MQLRLEALLRSRASARVARWVAELTIQPSSAPRAPQSRARPPLRVNPAAIAASVAREFLLDHAHESRDRSRRIADYHQASPVSLAGVHFESILESRKRKRAPSGISEAV